jgi:hypothetical protein
VDGDEVQVKLVGEAGLQEELEVVAALQVDIVE